MHRTASNTVMFGVVFVHFLKKIDRWIKTTSSFVTYLEKGKLIILEGRKTTERRSSWARAYTSIFKN